MEKYRRNTLFLGLMSLVKKVLVFYKLPHIVYRVMPMLYGVARKDDMTSLEPE